MDDDNDDVDIAISVSVSVSISISDDDAAVDCFESKVFDLELSVQFRLDDR